MKKRIISASLIAAALGLSAPAMALDVTPYGAIRVATWWTSSTYYNGTNPLHDADFTLDLQGDSLVGMRVKEGDFSGVAEMGAYNPKNRAGGVELRLLFGEWNFGNGKLRVGYAPSPYVYRSEQVYDADGGFNGYASLWDGRYAQIKLTMNNGFYLTLMKQATVGLNGISATNAFTTNTGNSWSGTPTNLTSTVYSTGYTDYDTFMPKTIAGYEGKAGIVTYGGGVAGNYYKIRTVAGNVQTGKDEIYSYLGFAHAMIDLAPIEIKVAGHTGQNIGNLMNNAAAAAGSFYNNSSATGKNAYTYGGWGQIGYKLNNKIKMFTGVAYESNEMRGRATDDRMAAFANLQYAVTKNFNVVPEFTYLNDLRSAAGAREPQIYAAGVKWEMKF
ncbi:hypothetical protein [Trichlorobacter lovleyi]|jgi:hypothetical protein|uniref:Porin n=1 Tax=Trichlorobacter lovleyi (strain ATCC BAA-1151 / DSM 17278 / SZ) TaxID=398767 RepID=B3E5J2_TRIL1|nr:hypothetical protein [Trichlorobacter lovleyi]ACD94663.1 hypothetical protein Glov_0940 [Trichlorobacter lovleyi SZ]